MYTVSVTYIYSDVLLDVLKFLIFFTAAWIAQLGSAGLASGISRVQTPAELTPRVLK